MANISFSNISTKSSIGDCCYQGTKEGVSEWQWSANKSFLESQRVCRMYSCIAEEKERKPLLQFNKKFPPHTYRMHNLSNILHTFPVANGFLWVFIRILTEHNVLAAEIFSILFMETFPPSVLMAGRLCLVTPPIFLAKLPKK